MLGSVVSALGLVCWPHLDSCHLQCSVSRMISLYVGHHSIVRQTYNIICQIVRAIYWQWTYDIVRAISYFLTMSYVAIRHRMTYIRYRVTQGIHIVYDIACIVYDTARLKIHTSTKSYVYCIRHCRFIITSYHIIVHTDS
jgi:hypothetical protein